MLLLGKISSIFECQRSVLQPWRTINFDLSQCVFLFLELKRGNGAEKACSMAELSLIVRNAIVSDHFNAVDIIDE